MFLLIMSKNSRPLRQLTLMYKSKGKYLDNNISLSKAIKQHIAAGLTIEQIFELYPRIPKDVILKSHSKKL